MIFDILQRRSVLNTTVNFLFVNFITQSGATCVSQQPAYFDDCCGNDSTNIIALKADLFDVSAVLLQHAFDTIHCDASRPQDFPPRLTAYQISSKLKTVFAAAQADRVYDFSLPIFR